MGAYSIDVIEIILIIKASDHVKSVRSQDPIDKKYLSVMSKCEM